MKSEDLVELLDDISSFIDDLEFTSMTSMELKEKIIKASHCLEENVLQLKIDSNKDNVLEPSHIRLIDGITFENSHLVAEHILKKDRNIATALAEELKMQMMLGDKNVG